MPKIGIDKLYAARPCRSTLQGITAQEMSILFADKSDFIGINNLRDLLRRKCAKIAAQWNFRHRKLITEKCLLQYATNGLCVAK